MTKSTITRERLEELAAGQSGFNLRIATHEESQELARIALAAMDSEPEELPLDYLQGHRDGLEWASQLAKANHPETGDWLYDDPIELAKAISKGPDMPPEPTVRDGEPVAWIAHARTGDQLTTDSGYVANAEGILGLHSTPLYRHAQQPVVLDEMTADGIIDMHECGYVEGWNAYRAAMLQAGTLTNEDTRQVDELTMWIKRLVRSLKNSNPDSKLPREAMDYLTAKGLISVGDILR